MATPRQGEVLWTPSSDARQTSEIGRFMDFVRDRSGRDFADYQSLWEWSISDLEGFWAAIWDFYGIRAHTPYERVMSSPEMPGVRWFEGATLNYAEHMVGTDEDLDRVAIIGESQTRPRVELTFAELRDQIARARAGLKRLGVGPGDRVAAYMPNVPETIVAFGATASLGAIWASCAPEFGARSVVSRFGQIEPKVLFAITGYTYGEKPVDRQAEVAAILEEIPSIEHVVHMPYGGDGSIPGATSWDELVSEPGPLEFDPVPVDHPLYVLFSSGTTGLPKAIVHGHGTILVEHLKNLGLCWDLHAGDALLWFTTTAWMMWNALVSGLVCRAAVVTIDGNPLYPDLARAVAPGRGDRRHADGRQPGVRDGLPQGGHRAGQGVRPQPHPAVRRRRLAATHRGLRLDLREGEEGRAAQRRQRRHRRLLGLRLRLSDHARVRRRDDRLRARRGREGLRPERPAGGGRARRDGDPHADAVDAGLVLERPRRRRATTRPTSTCTRASGATATGSCSPSAGAA